MRKIETKDLEKILSKIELSKPTRIDPAAVSKSAKMPFKALVISEVIYCRNLELLKSTLVLINCGQYLGATILTRSILESFSVLFYLCKIVDASIASKSLEKVDDKFMQILFGGRRDYNSYQAINILTLIEKVKSEVPSFSENYDILSEYAHPNWSGCAKTFGIIDKNNLLVELMNSNNLIELSLINSILFATETLFIDHYKKLKIILLEFAQLCEKIRN